MRGYVIIGMALALAITPAMAGDKSAGHTSASKANKVPAKPSKGMHRITNVRANVNGGGGASTLVPVPITK